jgi:hypothetical protein
MKFLKLLAITTIGTLSASSCFSQERTPFILQPSEEIRTEFLERQDKRHRRLEADNLRAQRSICNGCREIGGTRRTQPADPFASLPNWDDLPLADAMTIDLEP